MTPQVPSSPAQSRHGLSRSPLACLNCRRSKAKCDGLVPSALAKQVAPASWPHKLGDRTHDGDQELDAAMMAPVAAEVKCWRCERLELECTWRPCHRSGRPPKGHRSKKRSIDAASARDEEEDPTLLFSIPQAHTSTESDQSTIIGSQMLIDGDPLLILDSGEQSVSSSTTNTIHSPTDLFAGQSMFEDLIESALFSDASVLEESRGFFVEGSPPCPEQQEDRVDRQNGPLSTPPYNQLAIMRQRIQSSPTAATSLHVMPKEPVSLTDLGIARFFNGIGLSLPVFKNKADFLLRVDHCEAQKFAAATLGHALYEGSTGESFCAARTKSLACLDSTAFQNGLLSTDMAVLVAHLTALILVIYVDYGLEENNLLLSHINQARNAALASALPFIDGQPSSTPGSYHWIVEAARRTWWELWVLDRILDVVSGGQTKSQFSDVHANVRYPGEDDRKEREMWNIRIRSISLLMNAVSASRLNLDTHRLQAADRIQSDAISEAQQLFLSSVRACKRAPEGSEEETSCLLSRRAVFFDCLMMLYAGQIHLHRMFWFSDLTLDLTSCSFHRKMEELNGPVLQQRPERQVGLIEASVKKIVHAAESILHLMRFDTDSFFQKMLEVNGSQNLPIYSSHWPPIGCCQMVASYGLVVGIAASPKEDLASSVSPFSDNEASFPHHSDTSQSADPTSIESSDFWRTEQSISSIGMAEASLGILAEVWPVAKRYRDEVHQCRLAISQATV